jgi:hypothetical protein
LDLFHNCFRLVPVVGLLLNLLAERSAFKVGPFLPSAPGGSARPPGASFAQRKGLV